MHWLGGVRRSTVERAEAALAHGQRVTPAIERSVSGPARPGKRLVGDTREPAVDGEVEHRPGRVAEESGLDVSVRPAEEPGPVALRTVEYLEGRDLLRPDLILPDYLEHQGSPSDQWFEEIEPDRSVTNRGAFAPGVGCSGEPHRLALGVVFDRQRLGVAELGLDVDGVTHSLQLAANGERYALFDREPVRDYEAEAGGGDRLLDVHVEVDDVGEHLGRRLQDGAAAGGSYGHPGPPVAHDEGRTEGVGDLAPGGGVEGVASGLEAGPRDLVVEPDACPLGHDLAPEDVAQGLRRADDVPLPVRHDEVGGVLLRVRRGRGRKARGRTGEGAVGLHGRVVRGRLRKVY